MNSGIQHDKLLFHVTKLSHEFGTSNYVCGGGGNTSCKNHTTLWIKPSGTSLADLTPRHFIAMDRAKLGELYLIQPPQNAAAREALVKEKMEYAVLPGVSGRASVEAPLHNSLNARYVVHTHPAIVNGITCAKECCRAVAELFPSALGLDYIDPGYTLCMRVRQEVLDYKEHCGKEPSIILLKNHGVFVAADSPQQMRQLYADMLDTLKTHYRQAGVSLTLDIAPLPSDKQREQAKQTLLEAIGSTGWHIEISGQFKVAAGPISPDHIVYAKSYPFIGAPMRQTIAAFEKKNGYLPQVVSFDGMVFGIGQTSKKAKLALELAQDGALVQQLAQAFGGIEYMTDRAREFIENWEVESYRSKQI